MSNGWKSGITNAKNGNVCYGVIVDDLRADGDLLLPSGRSDSREQILRGVKRCAKVWLNL